jgi:hypothetical protein
VLAVAVRYAAAALRGAPVLVVCRSEALVRHNCKRSFRTVQIEPPYRRWRSLLFSYFPPSFCLLRSATISHLFADVILKPKVAITQKLATLTALP